MKKSFSALANYFLPHFQSPEETRKAKVLINFLVVLSLFSLTYLFICYYTDIIVGVWTNVIMFPCSVIGLYVFKKSRSFIGSCNIAVFGFVAGISEGVVFSGNIESPAILWLLAAPSLGFLLGSKNTGVMWTIIVSILMLAFGVLVIMEVKIPYLFPAYLQHYMLTFTLIAVAVFLAIVINIYDKYRTEYSNALEAEKIKSETMLLNILPHAVVEELKEKDEYSPRLYEHVTILFADFAGFTRISEQLTPRELVDEIHYCFKAFDLIMEKHGVEKIKTIGDSYMAASGVPQENVSHALNAAKAAIEMRNFIAARKVEKLAAGMPPFEVRIGIHSGQVIAGIVGNKKFAYDIWGDAVNIASRLESSGVPGKINISGATYDLVKDNFTCTYRGKVAAKNKGEMDMYFIEPIQG